MLRNMEAKPVLHTLKFLVPTLCLVAMLTYGLFDQLRNFVFGIFIPQYHYPYSVALSFAQVLVSLLFLNLLHVLDLVSLKPYSRSLGEKMLVPAICLSTHDVLVMWAKASSLYSGLYTQSLLLLPLATVGFSFFLKLPSLPSVHTSVLIFILSGTSFVLTVSHELTSIHPLDYMYAPLTVLLHSVFMTFLAKILEAEHQQPPDSQASMFDIYYAQLVTQGCVLGLLWLLHPDGPWKVLSLSSWHSLLFLGYLLALLLLSMVLNLTIAVSALRISPFAAAVLHSARQIMRPFIHFL
ncbi:uncharacterized protein isoform X2 [Takifugu rubripes]|uniref:Si:ch211-207n2.7 n=1 Tax=Takifugu rubripes TaxID=31033 RepID=A0A3B5KM23_TAKRU|nr:uncharacterized protein LOC115249526 isoform X2 [Takifugu rubripes]